MKTWDIYIYIYITCMSTYKTHILISSYIVHGWYDYMTYIGDMTIWLAKQMILLWCFRFKCSATIQPGMMMHWWHLMATGNLLVLIGTSTANDGFQIAMFGVEDIPYGSLWICMDHWPFSSSLDMKLVSWSWIHLEATFTLQDDWVCYSCT